MLTPPSTTNGQGDEDEQAIMSQVDELKQLFLDHERIIHEKSTNIESISERIKDVIEKSEFDISIEDIRNSLNGLLGTFQGKLASSCSEKRQIDREDTLHHTFESFAELENEDRADTPHETISQLQGFLHSKDHDLGKLSLCFNDVLESTNELMSSIPMNKTNSAHINAVISLIEDCIGSFCT